MSWKHTAGPNIGNMVLLAIVSQTENDMQGTCALNVAFN